MSAERKPEITNNDLMPRMAGGSGDEPRLSRSAQRRKEFAHAELSATIDQIRGFDATDLPDGDGRGFIKSIIKR